MHAFNFSIYLTWSGCTDEDRPEITEIKVGRSINLIKRIDQWTKQCGSKELLLLGFWPGNIENPSLDISMMKGRIRAGKKGILCHRLEKLVHLEISDLVVHKQYLDPGFMTGRAKGPDSDSGDDDDTTRDSATRSSDCGEGKGRKKGNGKGKSKSSSPLSSPRKAIPPRDSCPDCELKTF